MCANPTRHGNLNWLLRLIMREFARKRNRV